MRILMTIHHELEAEAGAPGVTMRLAEEFVSGGHHVDILSFDDLPARLGGRGRAVAFPGYVARRIRRSQARQSYDVIDASSGDSAWLRATAPRLRRSLLVVRSHGLEHVHDRRLRARYSPLGRLYHGRYRLDEVARAMRRADLNLMLNRGDARFATEQLGVPPDRVRVVPNGVPAAFLLDHPPAPNASPRVVVVGSHIERKGVAYAAAALNVLLDRHRDLAAAFLGTRCRAEHVLSTIQPALRDRVRVVPHYANGSLPDLVRAGDIHLFPTLAEGFPVALLETMARGLVPVTTAVDGPTEVATDGVDALVVPPRDAPALVRAIESLLRDGELRHRLSVRAAATARRYAWPAVAAENLRVVTDALDRKRRAAGGECPGASTGRGRRGSA